MVVDGPDGDPNGIYMDARGLPALGERPCVRLDRHGLPGRLLDRSGGSLVLVGQGRLRFLLGLLGRWERQVRRRGRGAGAGDAPSGGRRTVAPTGLGRRFPFGLAARRTQVAAPPF
eukprot:5336781-Alexandrium_andersonii.AAC.1